MLFVIVSLFQSLDVSYCPEIDDWCLDRISGEFQDSLESLDISGCRYDH